MSESENIRAVCCQCGAVCPGQRLAPGWHELQKEARCPTLCYGEIRVMHIGASICTAVHTRLQRSGGKGPGAVSLPQLH